MEKIIVVILAGGMGSRIGGAKSQQLLNGRPLLEWVLDAIRPQCDEVLISANGDSEFLGRFGCKVGCKVIADWIPGSASPLSGLQSAMYLASHEMIASVPCDAPFLPATLIQQLYSALKSADSNVAIAMANGREQSAIALYNNKLLKKLNLLLENGERKVIAWHETLRSNTVELEDAAAFLNINTAEELMLANRKLHTGESSEIPHPGSA